MLEALIAIVIALGGLGSLPFGMRAIHHAQYQRCLANITRLEIETGIVEAPPTKFQVVAERNARIYSQSLSRAAPTYSGYSKQEREILRRGNASPADLAVLRRGAYRRWLERQ